MNSIIKKLLLVLLFMLPICAFASSYPYKIGSIFDDMVSLVGTTSTKWQSPMKLMAIQIFSIFFIPETLWIIIKKILEGDIGRAWTLFFLRMITGGFYFYWITNPEIYFGIIQLTKLARKYIQDIIWGKLKLRLWLKEFLISIEKKN